MRKTIDIRRFDTLVIDTDPRELPSDHNWQNKTYMPEDKIFDMQDLRKAMAMDRARRKRKPLNWFQCLLHLPGIAVVIVVAILYDLAGRLPLFNGGADTRHD